MTTWSISSMTLADIDIVLEIENASFKTPWSRGFFEEEIAKEHSYCRIVRKEQVSGENPVIAYMIFRVLFDEMHIFKIAVDPKWRNKGIASLLLCDSFREGVRAGATAAYLEVRQSNQVAITFYSKSGFKIIGKRLNYYQEDREDALVMMKILKGEL